MSLSVKIQYLGFLCCAVLPIANRSIDGFFDEPLRVGDGRLKSNPFM